MVGVVTVFRVVGVDNVVNVVGRKFDVLNNVEHGNLKSSIYICIQNIEN